MKHSFNFYTQYNQFYLVDKDVQPYLDDINFWTDDAFSSRLALSKGIVGVGTQSYGQIKGELEIMDRPSTNFNAETFDHIVEGGIHIQSGELYILDCPNNEVEASIKLSPGNYRVRIYGSNFASVHETDLISDEDDDYYRVEIWKDDDSGRKVLKQYKDTP